VAEANLPASRSTCAACVRGIRFLAPELGFALGEETLDWDQGPITDLITQVAPERVAGGAGETGGCPDGGPGVWLWAYESPHA